MSTRELLKIHKEEILDLYINKKVKPADIALKLGFKYWQPIYNLLKREGVFDKHSTGNNYIRRYAVNESYFDEIDSEDKAYVLGFIAADGYIDEKNYRVVISLNSKDRDILEKIRIAMFSDHPIKDFIKDKKYNHSTISINSKGLVGRLQEIGLYSGKSLTMDSSIVNHIPDCLMRHFLRGYFDGDGCLTYGKKYKSGIKYLVQIVGTKEFLKNTYDIFCKTNCSLYKYKTCNMYCWKISKKSQVDDFLEYIYRDSSIYLERKFESAHLKP